MNKNPMQKAGRKAPSQEHRPRRIATGAKARYVDPLQDAKETDQSYSLDVKYIQPLADGDTEQADDAASSESINVLLFTYPAPSEGQGKTMNEDDKQKELVGKINELRIQYLDQFDRALAEFGFVLAASIVTENGWVKKSALPAGLAAKQRADDVKRNRAYRAQRSPEKIAAQTAQQTATQKARRMERRQAKQAPKPT